MVTIVEQNKEEGGSGVVGLYLNGDKVVFKNNFSSPHDDVTSYDVEMTFDIYEYKRGIQELKQKGRCTIKGEHDWEVLTIAITTDETTRRVFGKMSFCHKISSNMDGTFFVGWNIEDISLTIK